MIYKTEESGSAAFRRPWRPNFVDYYFLFFFFHLVDSIYDNYYIYILFIYANQVIKCLNSDDINFRSNCWQKKLEFTKVYTPNKFITLAK